MSDKVITMSNGTFRSIVVLLVGMLLALWLLTLYIWGGASYRQGRKDTMSERLQANPSQEFIESGLPFCWSEGNWYHVRPGRGGFRIKP